VIEISETNFDHLYRDAFGPNCRLHTLVVVTGTGILDKDQLGLQAHA